MKLPSQKLAFDNRLLAVDKLFREIKQKRYAPAQKALRELSESDFEGNAHETALFCSLMAESCFYDCRYPKALEYGLRASKIFADLPTNDRYGKVLFVLAKIYYSLGDMKNAELRARDSVASYRRAGDIEGQISASSTLAQITYIRGGYSRAIDYLEEALELAKKRPRKRAQLSANIAWLYVLIGRWPEAEKALHETIQYKRQHKEEIALANNLIALGHLHTRRREFSAAARCLQECLEIIERLDLKREKMLYLEFAGELAYEKGDTYRAKALLSEGYHQARLTAASSAMVAQTVRRLAEAEFALDNIDEAMKHAQKALEVSLEVGEKVEVGASKRVIANVFATRGEYIEAIEYLTQSAELLREVGDPYELAKTLLAMAEIKAVANDEGYAKIRIAFDEAARLFKKLKVDYWQAEVEFRAGVFACQQRDLSTGFKKLSRAERIFSFLSDKAKVRAVNQFLQSLSEQAVALSISEENEFKIFGNAFSNKEAMELKTGQIEEIFHVLLKRTEADRAVIYCPDFDEAPVVSSFPLSGYQAGRFAESLKELLDEEIAVTKPTLLMDCRRDPYINDLFPETSDTVASVVVVPFKMSGGSTSYLYIDKLAKNNSLDPFNQTQLNFAVGFTDVIAFKATEMQKAQLLEDNRRLKAQLQDESVFPNIVTQNGKVREMLAQIRQVVDSNISIAIEGETGSGKDLLARTIHYNSNRRDRRFITVNCAALPESLLESELFGYRKGAFTGADSDKPGLFSEADGGTFFLDEIADMPLSIQAKILRILEEKELIRLGETKSRKVDVRIISATNKDLKEEIGANRFRKDLYYRLTALTFRLPPLRDRKEDIPLLVNHFLAETDKRLSPEIMKHLVAYKWPGNIRELDNEVKKLVLLAGQDEEIKPAVLSSRIRIAVEDESPSGAGKLEPEIDNKVEFGERYSLYDYLAAQERKFIIKALRERKRVKKHAASMLNIPESTLRLKIKQYGIDIRELDGLT
jgi:transcriptional regulator with GAF, ATPase, and Fis domain